MKRMNFAPLLLLLLSALFACGQQPSTSASQTTASAQQQTTTGRLSGYRNRFTVGTSKGDIYLLEGDDATFKKLNGARVSVTGVVSPSKKGLSHQDALDYQFPTLKVNSLKKLDSTCGLWNTDAGRSVRIDGRAQKLYQILPDCNPISS